MFNKLCSAVLVLLMIINISFVANAAEEIIITPHDDVCIMDSNWKESTANEAKGPTGLTSFYGNHPITYSVKNVPSGKYDVYVYNLPIYSTPDAIGVNVVYADGTEEVELNYRDSPKGWLPIGTYNFSGGEKESLTFSIMERSIGQIQRAVAVKLSPNDGKTSIKSNVKKEGTAKYSGSPEVIPEGGELIMGSDNPYYSQTGDWTESGLEMISGEKCWYSQTPGATATWKPNLAKQDGVTIYYMKAAATANEDNGVLFEIFAEGETTEVVVDVTEGEVGWTPLGTFNFKGDNSEYITLTKQTSGTSTRSTDLKFSLDKNSGGGKNSSALKGTDNEILERMGVLLGDENGLTDEYMERQPSRVQAATMVLRLRGKDREAMSYSSEDNFTDCKDADWFKNILAYIKAHPEYGMIGVGENVFGVDERIDAQQYTKILLEALGYECGSDFSWDDAQEKANEIGLNVDFDGEFSIAKLADATTSALNLTLNDSNFTLLSKIIGEREGIYDDQYLSKPKELTPELKAAQIEARHKVRGLIYNDDGNDTYADYANYPNDYELSEATEPITTENFLSKRTYGVEDSQVTTIMYCDGVFNSYHHISSGETTVRKRDWSYGLKEYTGMDSLETKIDFAQKNGIELFWSMRMNDCHDAGYEESDLDPWKQAHLDWLFSRKNEALLSLRYGTTYWSAVDYAVPEVRQKVYNIIKDTVTRYDIDGIQLDFTRHPIVFKSVAVTGEANPEEIEQMNNLIRSIRTMMNQISIERGKPLLLAIYVKDSLDFNKALGLDVRQWMEEDLIDMAAIRGTIAMQPWEDSIAEYSPYDIEVHATFDTYMAVDSLGQPDWNKEAALAYHAGVDGIQLYNNFNPNGDLFDTLGSKDTCGPVDPNYKSLMSRRSLSGLNVKNPGRFIKDIPYSAYK